MDLRNLLNIEYPIIQGAMAHIANGAFAAAISNAGGMGLIAAGGRTPEDLCQQIQQARKLTEKPFGVNLMLMDPNTAACAELVCEEKIPFLTTGAGSPDAYLPTWKAAGITVFPVIASSAQARRAENAGADGVIAEGTEAGGHIGELTTMAMVPQIVRAVKIPVVAAGGIATGQQMLAALALGACGVQIGTAFLAASECPIHENFRAALIKAKDIDTVVIGRNGGVPARGLKTPMTQEYLRLEKQGVSREELERFTLGSLRRAVFEGDLKKGGFMAGQVSGLITEIRPARQIIESLFADCRQTLQELRIE